MANATEATESIIRKIQKLLELGSRSKGNEEEAARALEAAQTLMAKHNLDVAVVRETAVAGGTVPVEAQRERKNINRSAQYDWQKSLWKTIADCNFCWHYITTFDEKDGKNRAGDTKYKRVKRHVIIGTVENVTMVHMMGDYLCDTIERLLPFSDNRERLSRDAISWRAGCAKRLEERIHRQRFDRQNMQSDNSPGTGLAIRVRDIEMSEYKANYDFSYGKGAYARLEAAEKERAEKHKSEVAVEPPPETPAETRKREKDEERWRVQQRRQAERDARKYNSSMFREGYREGGTISLSTQIGGGQNQPKL